MAHVKLPFCSMVSSPWVVSDNNSSVTSSPFDRHRSPEYPRPRPTVRTVSSSSRRNIFCQRCTIDDEDRGDAESVAIADSVTESRCSQNPPGE